MTRVLAQGLARVFRAAVRAGVFDVVSIAPSVEENDSDPRVELRPSRHLADNALFIRADSDGNATVRATWNTPELREAQILEWIQKVVGVTPPPEARPFSDRVCDDMLTAYRAGWNVFVELSGHARPHGMRRLAQRRFVDPENIQYRLLDDADPAVPTTALKIGRTVIRPHPTPNEVREIVRLAPVKEAL